MIRDEKQIGCETAKNSISHISHAGDKTTKCCSWQCCGLGVVITPISSRKPGGCTCPTHKAVRTEPWVQVKQLRFHFYFVCNCELNLSLELSLDAREMVCQLKGTAEDKSSDHRAHVGQIKPTVTLPQVGIVLCSGL